MDDMVTNQNFRNRGSNVITAEHAIIESISRDRQESYVTISYGVMGDFNRVNMQTVTLIVGRDTVIRDQFGQPMSLRDLREGMTVNAEFSAVMTRSIPPQSRAFAITVIEDCQFSFTEGRVMEVEPQLGFLYTGDPLDIYSQMRFVITDATTITDRRGRRIRLRDLRPGDFVRIEHAMFQTASIPPQTTAFAVQVL
jgi:hypothetical protein